jgi:excisionase family DNA binding protein
MSAQADRLTADDVMTGREVAELLHMPVSTVEDPARRGELPSRKVGRRRLYIRQRIEARLTSDDTYGAPTLRLVPATEPEIQMIVPCPTSGGTGQREEQYAGFTARCWRHVMASTVE